MVDIGKNTNANAFTDCKIATDSIRTNRNQTTPDLKNTSARYWVVTFRTKAKPNYSFFN